MKRIFSNVMLLAAAATAFFSCQKPEVIVPETSQEVTLTFASEKPAFDDETKTEWTGNTIQWSKGDKISVAYTVDGKWQSNTGNADGNAKLYKSDELKESSEIAQFNVSTYFEGTTEGTHVFYGVYPAPTETSFASAPVADLEVPSRQTPKDSSFDPQADLMTGVSVGEFTSRPAKGETISMKWNRLVAHANITLRKLNGAVAGETVLNIKLTAQEDAKLVGNQQINILKNEVVNNDGLSNTIEIDGSNLAIDADGNLEFWACVLPETIKALTVIVDTDKATYTREITGISRTFIQNARNTLPINMSGAVREEKASNGLYYEKVTSQLEDWSGQYLVVFGNNAHATLDSKDFKATTVVAIDDDKIVASDDYAKAVMTVTKSGEKYNMTYPNGKYFSMAHNSSGSSESPFDLEFTYTDDGVKIIGYVTAKEDYYILYNNGGNYYRCYVDKNGQAGYSLPILYRLSDDNTGGGETPEPEHKTLVSIAVSNEKTEYYVGEEFVKPTVTATYDDASTADVTNSAEFSGYDMAAVGDQTVTVSYTKDSVTKKAEYRITVNEAPSGPIVATIAEFLEEEPSTAVWYQLTGTISNIKSTDYGNFDLTDGTGSVYVYGLTSAQLEKNDKSFASLGLKEGDIVTLIGNVGEYNANKQVANAYHVSSEKLAAWDAPEIVCSNNKVTITAEAGVSVYYTTNGETPSPSSTLYGEAFEINSSITVKAIAVADGRPQSIVAEKLCDYVDLSDQPATTDATLTFDDKAKRTVFTDNQQVWTENNITLTNDKGSSTNNVADYAKPARFYKSSKITVEAPGKITQIVFDCNSSYATALKNSITAGGTVTVSSDKVTVVLTTPAESFVISSLTGGQVRMDALTVTYIAD